MSIKRPLADIVEPDHITLGDGEDCHAGALVRVGNGRILWDVESIDVDTRTAYLYDRVTGNRRKAAARTLTLSVPGW
jgi:hypothetical protein